MNNTIGSKSSPPQSFTTPKTRINQNIKKPSPEAEAAITLFAKYASQLPNYQNWIGTRQRLEYMMESMRNSASKGTAITMGKIREKIDKTSLEMLNLKVNIVKAVIAARIKFEEEGLIPPAIICDENRDRINPLAMPINIELMSVRKTMAGLRDDCIITTQIMDRLMGPK